MDREHFRHFSPFIRTGSVPYLPQPISPPAANSNSCHLQAPAAARLCPGSSVSLAQSRHWVSCSLSSSRTAPARRERAAARGAAGRTCRSCTCARSFFLPALCTACTGWSGSGWRSRAGNRCSLPISEKRAGGLTDLRHPDDA